MFENLQRLKYHKISHALQSDTECLNGAVPKVCNIEDMHGRTAGG